MQLLENCTIIFAQGYQQSPGAYIIREEKTPGAYIYTFYGVCTQSAPFFTFELINFQNHQARRYDSRTTIFSPEGRLYQVEYAMEAISHAGTCLGILAKDGILLAAERRNTNKLLDEGVFAEKIYKLNE